MSTLNKLGKLFSKKALRSLGAGVAVGSIMLGLGAFAKPASAVNIAGTEYDDEDFANALLDYSGSFTTPGGDLQTVVTDQDLTTYAFSFTPGAFVKLGFDTPVINASGADIALYDLGIPDTFQVSLDGVNYLSYESFDTGYDTENPTYDVNVATVDLSDFGLDLNETINEIFIKLDTVSADETVPSLALVAAIRKVPEPSAMFGLLATAGFLACQRKLKLSKRN
ncbi:PEP-CTERM sorting domain-containing protein [Sphaerospermopsis aphanizomenoides BCCUSP55]|uniref:PEP-CTERM sorting domain-containing protein n=1 Tax=Sphaerospermopsis aphanizomenoides TaxID=459663 RepID=UPI0019038CB5|nr:PEP-CTERM sorting domain-containing protein [Sphaerospermopsis aphanizomenoides]MBK1989842.1 PEP-CTERM sorting domain-containing protein [Sphaerospermopsis aphanizomenoides BCCUSP55]